MCRKRVFHFLHSYPHCGFFIHFFSTIRKLWKTVEKYLICDEYHLNENITIVDKFSFNKILMEIAL